MDKRSEVKKFWEERAALHGEDWQATIGEKYLRLLEIKTAIKIINKYRPKNVLDFGCGNGYSTAIYAKKFIDVNFIGIDYSENMIRAAQSKSSNNCKFYVGDVLDLASFKEKKYDLIITQRCLQNLQSYDEQKCAINNLICSKADNGVIAMMECSKTGVSTINSFRRKLGLKEVDGIEPWHNNFFDDELIENDYKVKIINFTSTYAFITKILKKEKLAVLGCFLPNIGNLGYLKIYLLK